MRMKIWEIVGVFAYTQVFALLESVILVVTLILIAELLPYQLLLKHFTTQAVLTSILATLWIIPLHYKAKILSNFPNFENSWLGAVWFGIVVALVIGFSYFLNHYSSFERAFRIFIEKLTVVSLFYLVVDLASLVIILVRNLVIATV
jgi:hypothetical protein